MTDSRIAPPKQARSQQTLDRLLDAAEELLGEKQLEEVTVAEIVERAGASVSSFYARFLDKDALLEAVFERVVSEGPRGITLSQNVPGRDGPPTSAAQVIDLFVAESVRVFRARRGLYRAIVRYGHSHPSAQLRRLSERASAAKVRFLTRLLLTFADQIGHPDPERAIPFAMVMAGAMLRESVLFPERQKELLALSDDALAEEATRAMLAYLGIPRAGSPTAPKPRTKRTRRTS